MEQTNVRASLEKLRISQTEAALLLSVSDRTVRRWVENSDELPGPAERALQAWQALDAQGLPWRPDAASMGFGDDAQIMRCREHAIELYETLERVQRRGGPAAPWQVDRDRGTATLGPVRLSFYNLANGGFSLQSYRRSDQAADPHRDRTLIEDGIACIAQTFARDARVRFTFAVTRQGNHVLLWDVTRAPTVVAKLSCGTVRTVLVRQAALTNEQCRFLVDCNKELLAEVAQDLYATGTFTDRADGIRVIEIGAAQAKRIADRFSSSALSVVPYWVSSQGKGGTVADYAVVVLSAGEFGVRVLSQNAERRNPGGLRIGHSVVFKGRRDLDAYIAASEKAGYTFTGKEVLS